AKTESGASAPVDEELKADGDSYEPENPVTDVDVPKEAGEGIVVGNSGVRVSPDASGTNPSDAVLLNDDKLFYGNTDTDTDTVVAPVTTGVELFSQFRSKESPDVQRVRFSLPLGAILRETEGGGAEVIQGTKRLLRILPPRAKDAQGEEVPVSLRVSGTALDVVAVHRSKDFAYPILVDPVIEDWGATLHSQSWYQGQNLGGLNHWRWEWTTPTADLFMGRLSCSLAIGTCYANRPEGSNDGLHVYARPNTSYPAGTLGATSTSLLVRQA
ncbi:MAG: hypothetical protein M3450_15980, partial [Actinomycetota bacterium]|nr:hypothetical protein [Actinomycetota bacterium]